MKNATVRGRLLSSASVGICGALALAAFPATANAQATTCSTTGTAVNCVDGSTTIATGFVDSDTVVTSGPGFVSTDPTSSTITLISAGNGPIHTSGAGQSGINSSATADLTLTYNGDVVTDGDNADAYHFQANGNTIAITYSHFC